MALHAGRVQPQESEGRSPDSPLKSGEALPWANYLTACTSISPSVRRVVVSVKWDKNPHKVLRMVPGVRGEPTTNESCCVIIIIR